MSTLDFANLISAAEENNEFVILDDGFYYFWPKANAGAYSSWMLRVLADECDRRNKSWQEDIDFYYANYDKKEEHL